MKPSIAIPALLLLILAWHQATCQIAVYGDTRSNPEIHYQLIEKMGKHNPRLVIHTGDLNSKGTTQQEYDKFFATTKPLGEISSLYAVKGNHEQSRELFLMNFPSLGQAGYTRIEYDGLFIYLLDSTADLSPGSPQYKWLGTALSDSLPGIVVLHHPIFSSGEHGGDHDLQMFFPNLLSKGRILAVFSGHDHDYERSEYQGIKYIVSAGGGSVQRQERTPNPYSQIFEISYHYLIINKTNTGWIAEVWDLQERLIDSFILDSDSHE